MKFIYIRNKRSNRPKTIFRQVNQCPRRRDNPGHFSTTLVPASLFVRITNGHPLITRELFHKLYFTSLYASIGGNFGTLKSFM